MLYFKRKAMSFLLQRRKKSCLKMQNGSGIHCLSEKGAPGRKVDFEIYKSILYNLEIRKVYSGFKAFFGEV